MGFKLDTVHFKAQQLTLKSQYEKAAKKRIGDNLAAVYAYAVPLTPVGEIKGGRLRRGWDIKPVVKTVDGYQGAVVNNVNYSKHVEYGHRTRYGTGKATPKPGAQKVVEGRYMLKQAIKKALKREGNL